MDWIQGAASLINGLIRTHRVNEWAKLIFTLLFSYLIALSITIGAVLASGASTPRAIGAGLVSAAVAATACFRRSQLTKGLLVVLPQAEANQEMTSDLQTIQRT